MQRRLQFLRRSEDEDIKDAGLVLDFDEMARKGVMSKEEKNVAKWYGIYASRQPGNHMARIVIPGGVLTSTQARNIAKVSEKFAMGKLNITTRTSIQLHWLKLGSLADIMRALADEGSTTRHGCGDVTRNVTACPLAETCRYRRFNVLPFAQRTARRLGDSHDLDNLPRKFKISYSGCGAGCAQPFINCVGAIAVGGREGSEEPRGFKVVIGGGMGATPFIAKELFSFVPAERMVDLTRAIALLFRDHGDRFNRSKARLKYVVERYGIERCREIVIENLRAEGVSTEGFVVEGFREADASYPDRPLAEEDTVGTDGSVTLRIMVPKGEMGHRQLKRVAELSEIYGDQRVRTTNRQNLELHGIPKENAEEVKREIRKIGLGTTGFYGLRDIVPCVGTTYCPKAVSETRALYDLLQPLVAQPKYAGIEKAAVINITGCPNSCSPYRIADIGFRGSRIREELGSTEGYEVTLGGTPERLGEVFGEFKRDDCPGVVEKILDTFIALRSEAESLSDCVLRVGAEPFKKAVYE